jgi:dienelactone hydrolase
MISFTPSSTLAGQPQFSSEDVINGVRLDPGLKDQPGRVWVEDENQAECLRLYGASLGARGSLPLIFFEGDVIDRGNYFAGDIVVREGYPLQTPFFTQAEAEQFASALARPFVNLARPGVFGSSGNHFERRREREVALIDAALNRLQEGFGWQEIDLAGLSGGGHLVAALMGRRSDINCAIIASGNVAVRKRNQARRMTADATGYTDFVDPIELVADVALHPPHRIIVLTDPEDTVVSAECQTAYVDALRSARVEQRFVTCA